MTGGRLCIVPMKPLARAKARLAEVLSPDERRRLSLAMLEDVTRAATALDHVWVLNSDDDAADVAARAGAEPRPDPAPDEGQNASLNAATALAVKEGYDAVLIVSADCAGADAEDVRAMALGTGVTLAPDRYGTGTNALWRMPPECIEVQFGDNSREAHEAMAHVNRVPLAILPRPRLALDVDRPEDLVTVLQMGAGPATSNALAELGYPARARR